MSSIRFSLPSENESLNIVMQNHQHADLAIDARRIRARCQGPESVKRVENLPARWRGRRTRQRVRCRAAPHSTVSQKVNASRQSVVTSVMPRTQRGARPPGCSLPSAISRWRVMVAE